MSSFSISNTTIYNGRPFHAIMKLSDKLFDIDGIKLYNQEIQFIKLNNPRVWQEEGNGRPYDRRQ